MRFFQNFYRISVSNRFVVIIDPAVVIDFPSDPYWKTVDPTQNSRPRPIIKGDAVDTLRISMINDPKL
jgi:hypothetical protein